MIPILYQSKRTQNYLDIIKQLQAQNLVYKCSCSRQKLRKQHNAAPIDNSCPELNLWHSLFLLGHSPPKELSFANINKTLQWGIKS